MSSNRLLSFFGFGDKQRGLSWLIPLPWGPDSSAVVKCYQDIVSSLTDNVSCSELSALTEKVRDNLQSLQRRDHAAESIHLLSQESAAPSPREVSFHSHRVTAHFSAPRDRHTAGLPHEIRAQSVVADASGVGTSFFHQVRHGWDKMTGETERKQGLERAAAHLDAASCSLGKAQSGLGEAMQNNTTMREVMRSTGSKFSLRDSPPPRISNNPATIWSARCTPCSDAANTFESKATSKEIYSR